MRLGFVVNRVATEQAGYTTTRLAMTATRMGHEVWLMGVDDFAHDPDGSVTASARTAPAKASRSLNTYLEKIQSDDAVDRLVVDELAC